MKSILIIFLFFAFFATTCFGETVVDYGWEDNPSPGCLWYNSGWGFPGVGCCVQGGVLTNSFFGLSTSSDQWAVAKATLVSIQNLADGDVVDISLGSLIWNSRNCGIPDMNIVGTNDLGFNPGTAPVFTKYVDWNDKAYYSASLSTSVTVSGYTNLLVYVTHPRMDQSHTYTCHDGRAYDNLHIVAPDHAELYLPNGVVPNTNTSWGTLKAQYR